jgi:hypothetical protein
MMIQRKTEADQGLRTLMKILTLTERIAKAVVQYFTSLGREHYCGEMFNFVKRWDKYLNAYGDYMEK